MTQQDRDRCDDIALHEHRGQRQATGFFHKSGQDFVAVFSSQEQGIVIFDRFASCFGPGEKEPAWRGLQYPKSLPASSLHEPLVVGGTAGQTLCRHRQHYHSFLPSHQQVTGYDDIKPRIIAHLHSADFSIGQGDQPKSRVIALKDGHGNYHVYIVFSDEKAKGILKLHHQSHPDMDYHRSLMRKAPLPSSNLQTIHIGGQLADAAARMLCLSIEAPYLSGQGFGGVPEGSVSA